MNNFVPWPTEWPKHYNSNVPCDMLVGPCACGAWHVEGEFESKGAGDVEQFTKPSGSKKVT